uniref:Uncharacterized protein n=1 Tax=Arundo donax TaxID=35708 RepID=A0A0A9HRU8_ARUDO
MAYGPKLHWVCLRTVYDLKSSILPLDVEICL